MIYSVLQHKHVPVVVEKKTQYVANGFDDILIRYSVYDLSGPKNFVGYVDLQDTRDGVRVLYIKNELPKLYKHFAYVADQIEVEHCLKRKIENPYIHSVAALGTHVAHFKRGKRFIDEGINNYLEGIVKNLKKGERVITGSLGCQKMYMPMNMINEIKEKIKLHPLLKGLK